MNRPRQLALALLMLLLVGLTAGPLPAQTPAAASLLERLEKAREEYDAIGNMKRKGELRKQITDLIWSLRDYPEPTVVEAIAALYVQVEWWNSVVRSLVAMDTAEASAWLDGFLTEDPGCTAEGRSCRRTTLIRMRTGTPVSTREPLKQRYSRVALRQVIVSDPHVSALRATLRYLTTYFDATTPGFVMNALEDSNWARATDRARQDHLVATCVGFFRKAVRPDAPASDAAEATAAAALDASVRDCLLSTVRDEKRSRLAQRIALRLLGELGETKALPAIERILERQRDDIALVVEASRAAGRIGDPAAGAWIYLILVDWMKRAGKELRLSDLAALLELVAPLQMPAQSQILTALRSKQPELYIAALLSVGILEEKDIAKHLKKAFRSEDWRIRCAAIECCRRLRSALAVTLLIENMKGERGRLRIDLLSALHELTGAPMGFIPEDWEKWWEFSEDEYVPPEPGSVTTRLTGVHLPDSQSYFGFEVISRRLCFLIDISGSMQAQMTYDGESRPRVEVTKTQLVQLIQNLAKNAYCNVYIFHHTFDKVFERLTKMDKKRRRVLVRRVGELAAQGGTNIYDPLEDALRDPNVDTIYLLSDGQPGSGQFTDTHDILEAVRELNHTRRIQINTIAVGQESELMRLLAEQNHGQYQFLK